MINYNLLYNKAYARINDAKNILLLTHEKPDIDAVSSVCAFVGLLENTEKKYTAFCIDKPPESYIFIPYFEKISNNKNSIIKNFSSFDLIIVLDCGQISRTGLLEELSKRGKWQQLIEIDHHIKIEDRADIEIRNPEAASTTELVYGFFKANKLKINKNSAISILAGIMSDTGSFLYPSTSDKTIKISSEMLKLGARIPQIAENAWHNKSLSDLKIWGKAMSRLSINKKYNLAYTVLKQEDIKNAKDDVLDGVANFLGNMHNVKGVLFLREEKDGIIKGSLRSAHPTADMSILAQKLNGGGHSKAAGFKIKGKLEKIKNTWKII